MKSKLKLGFCFALCISVTLGFTTDRHSLVVSSTEPPKESSSEVAPNKEDVAPIVPKIYEMKVDTNVSNRFAKTSVVSKVKNLAKTPQEATFSVVLPETAYISGFVMEIDGKSYKAYVKEKEEAKQIYNEAVGRGQAAAHVEANARDSNRFTVSLNIEPQKKAVFTLTYEELLQRQNEQYEVVINIHPGQPVKDLNVEVHIDESRPLKFVKSPPLRTGNEISKNDDKTASLAEIKQNNSTSATVKFNPNIERQKQLATGLGTKEENGLAGQFVVQYDVERDPKGGEVLLKDGYFVHFFAPSEVEALPKQVIFVLDTSGSMDGNRIKQLKEAMNSILSELKKEDVFNIVEFSSIVKVWNVDKVQVDYEVGEDPWPLYDSPEAPQKNKTNQVLPPAYKATDENKEKAKKVVEKLNAYGGTDIKSALEVGLKLVKKNKENKEDAHQPIIVFLTDGEPTMGETNTEKITSAISEMNSGETRAPIFSLSFGDGADREFLQKISLKNLGFARHIYEAADASLQLQEFYKQISSPLLNNVNFKYVSNVTKLTKTVFPIYFRGSEIVVAGVAEDEFLPPSIEGNTLRGPIIWSPKVETPVGDLERLWAYLTIKQILEARDAAEKKEPYTKKALDIALKYSFVTPVSSLVVVKPNDTSAVDTEDASKTADRPYFLNRNYATPNLRPQLGLAGPSTLSFAAAAAGFGGAAPPMPQPAVQEADLEEDAYMSPEMFAPSTTDIPTTTKSQDLYEDIKNKLPWLKDIITVNGTITLPNGSYKISTNETQVTSTPQCPKTPINGTAGVCTLLPHCPQVFSLLTDAKVFQEFFCPLDTFVGVCCPIATDATSASAAIS
ncbi:inter-alpha-trypsin inhibitor heavy chain H4 isoform X2 [Tribolium castaneum]|uniref:Inter-alpha-trypsin inhibitor heavy chain H4-like Protein n=1 Tax=Tribolium castaneum TaxID=7070 RepID=D6WKJ2_TRICA|nr:PREDICTED: inter-alpha-trypsin inhibitor heavy chain H4 isoform X2 [Tribolium castaneum]EFA04008.2 Inter-alpha-trypsin inhibitor heavy chain H4-like Protein [Tribolium castaneum]|eukprot:XP_973726.1 PREDICTED: inter-alpha-trypsin inhibitor heavy chain H4 isoform X2 [Tribolium castaneum]